MNTTTFLGKPRSGRPLGRPLLGRHRRLSYSITCEPEPMEKVAAWGHEHGLSTSQAVELAIRAFLDTRYETEENI